MKKRVDQLKVYASAFLTCIFNCGKTSVLNHSFFAIQILFRGEE
jgi:hypothetical protein